MFTRYNVSGFVEELPQLQEEIRYRHACAALPATGVRPTQLILLAMQALVVAGGYSSPHRLSSVMILLPGADSWVPLSPLPRPLLDAQASIVGGMIRVIGGIDGIGGISRTEVMSYHLKV